MSSPFDNSQLSPGLHGFKIRFQNGYRLSVQYGVANYCSNRLGIAKDPRHEDLPPTMNCEVAVEDTNREGAPFVVIPMDVHGFVPISDLPDLMRCVKNGDFRSFCAILEVDYIMENDPTVSPEDIKEVAEKEAAADAADLSWGD
jgi:hypothetical protein